MCQCLRMVGAGQAILGVYSEVFSTARLEHDVAFRHLRAACRELDRASVACQEALLIDSDGQLRRAEAACHAAVQAVRTAGNALAREVYEEHPCALHS